MYKFIVADDHPMFRTALVQILEKQFESDASLEILQAQDLGGLQRLVAANPDTDLLLLDLNMPGTHGFGGLAFICGHYPQLPVMVVSASEEDKTIHRCIQHGAAGFLPKSSSPELFGAAVKQVLLGEIWLPEDLGEVLLEAECHLEIADIIATFTPQQFKVATMLIEGLLNKQIAYEINVTEATVKAHLTAIFRKLGVNSRTQAVLSMNKLSLETLV